MQSDEQLTRLVSLLTTPIHQKRRRNVLKSHLKFFGNKSSLTVEDVCKHITKKFMERKNHGDEITDSYIKSLASTLQTKYGMDKAPIYRFVRNLRKVYNSENPDRVFFTQDGKEFKIELDGPTQKVVKSDPL